MNIGIAYKLKNIPHDKKKDVIGINVYFVHIILRIKIHHLCAHVLLHSTLMYSKLFIQYVSASSSSSAFPCSGHFFK